jgi:multiple sugar transport system permease protein
VATLTTVTATSTTPLRRRRRVGPAPYLFLLPALTFFALFLALPAVYAIWLSIRKSRVTGSGFDPNSRKEVSAGLSNYTDSLKDPEFLHSLLRMLLYGAIVVPIMLGLALIFALLIDGPVARLRRFARISIFLPYAVPGIIATLLWGFIYLPGVSPIRYLADHLGLPVPNFFTPHAIFGSVSNVAIWGGTGFNMIVMYTALRAIPGELYDSARVDGCNEFQLATRIKIPLLTPALVLTTVFSLIATLQVFNEPTTLRPLTNVISSSWMPLMKVYRDAFIDGDLYSAAATSVILAVLTLALSFGLLRSVQRRAFAEEDR